MQKPDYLIGAPPLTRISPPDAKRNWKGAGLKLRMTLISYKFLFTGVSKTENLMPWNSNLWISKAEKAKFPEQKNTDLGILSESTIQISFIREIDILKSHCHNNRFINNSIIIKKTDSELRTSIAKSIEIVFSDSVKIRMAG